MSVLNAKHFHDEAAAFAEMEAILWPDGPVCPHCGGMDRVYVLKGVRSKPSKKHPGGIERHGLKKCGHCLKQFTVRMGTVMEETRAPLHKWFQAFQLMCASKKGISAHQLHRLLEVQYNTAWFMAHRIREAMRVGGLEPPMGGDGGVVEVDETVYGRAATHPKGRGPLMKRGITNSAHKNVILSLVERGGKVRSFHVEGSTVSQVIPIVNENVAKETAVMTDSAMLYKNRLKDTFASHDRVDHSAGEYARYEDGGPVISTNTVENYFSVFKRGMRGTYQHCKEKHLYRYLAEFDFRYNNRSRLGVEDKERATKAVVGARVSVSRIVNLTAPQPPKRRPKRLPRS